MKMIADNVQVHTTLRIRYERAQFRSVQTSSLVVTHAHSWLTPLGSTVAGRQPLPPTLDSEFGFDLI